MFPLRSIGHAEVEADSLSKDTQNNEAKIVLDPELSPGLSGLEPGQQLMVVFWFHLSEGFELLQHPRGDRTRAKRGVFALRSPRRPNPIGVTIVDLLGIEGNIIRVRGLDAFYGTPVLDLKPVSAQTVSDGQTHTPLRRE